MILKLKLPDEEPEFRQEADGKGQAGVGGEEAWLGIQAGEAGIQLGIQAGEERTGYGLWAPHNILRAERTKHRFTFKAGCQNSTIIHSTERVKARGCAVIYLKS